MGNTGACLTAGLGGSVGKKGRPRGKGLCLGERPGRQGTPPNARCRGEACWQEPGTTSWGMESCPERAPPAGCPSQGGPRAWRWATCKPPRGPQPCHRGARLMGHQASPWHLLRPSLCRTRAPTTGRAPGPGLQEPREHPARAMHVSFTFWVSS